MSPLLASAKARTKMLQELARPFEDKSIDVVVGIESRGFLFGMMLADQLNARFVMLRKPGKLPGETICEPYQLEYGMDSLEIIEDAIVSGDKVLIHDDVLATGGTAAAACRLVEKAGGEVLGLNFVLELDFLNGRKKLNAEHCHSVLHY